MKNAQHIRPARLITVPRLVIIAVIVCLLFQIQRSKSNELPKYSAPEFVGKSLLERVNAHRESIRVRGLSLDNELDSNAQRYCEMVAKGNLQASLSSNGAGLSGVAAWDDVRGVRRNVAVFECNSNSPALDVIRQWIANNNDVNNLENAAFTATGIGVVRRGNTYYVCQIFATK
jgi:uncharacterized protein YkwD